MTSDRASATGRSAVIGSGNIGTDLMIKVLRLRSTLEMARDGRHRPGLRRAAPAPPGSASPTTADGVDGLIALPGFDEIDVVFDATSAGGARGQRRRAARRTEVRVIDLTPAALGPFVVPAVNLDAAPRRARTSTWSPAAGRRPSRSSPRSRR